MEAHTDPPPLAQHHMSFSNHSRIIMWSFPQPCILVAGVHVRPTRPVGPAGTTRHHLKGIE